MQQLSGVPRKDLQWTPGAVGTWGRRVAVVGGTGGLGQAIARLLAAQGGKVTVVGQTFRDAGTAGLDFLKADLSSMAEAARVGQQLAAEPYDTFVLTTGIFAGPRREVTPEGIERDLAVSYLSRFVLVRSLAAKWTAPPPAGQARPRVFVMGMPGTGQLGNPDDLNAEGKYEAMPVHLNTVAANEALVVAAAKRWPGAAFFGLNPGLVKTNIRANTLGGNQSLRFKVVEALIGLFTPAPEQYAQKLVPLLLSPELDRHSGALFNARAQPIERTQGLDDERAEKFFAASEALLARPRA